MALKEQLAGMYRKGKLSSGRRAKARKAMSGIKPGSKHGAGCKCPKCKC